ncbi:MAG: MBL fold metallo-hydrolase, partial [Caldilineaceae bacterium]|nr:MBL fold metallo-hydrolase [Caldilineaceae bacterium]
MPDEQFSAPIRLELPFALERTTVNAYLFLEPEPILVDTGDLADATWQALEVGLAQHGLAVGDLRKVIISHTHIDHFGQAARLAETSDAHFYVIDAGFNWLTRFTEHWQMRYDYYRTVFLPATGMPAGEQQKVLFFSNRVLDIYRGVPATRVTALHPGEHLELGPYIWEVLHLPGHASTQTCFYQPATRQLLASDMLLRRTP